MVNDQLTIDAPLVLDIGSDYSATVIISRFDQCLAITSTEARALSIALIESAKAADAHLEHLRKTTKTSEQPTPEQIMVIRDAWNIEGPQPHIHLKAKKKLAKMWPHLYHALNDAF